MNIARNRDARGFTLIELLVVIAIIGILATLVLVALGTARTRARTARIKSDISQLRSIAEVVFDANDGGSYVSPNECFEDPVTDCGTIPQHPNIPPLATDVGQSGGALTIAADVDSYCVASTLPGTTRRFCADSSGNAGETSTTFSGCANANTLCP